MKKYRFLLAFVLCWFASSISLYIFDLIWPTDAEISIMNILAKTFGMSIVIIIVLLSALNNKNKEKD